MKKFLTRIIFVLVMFSLSNMAFANSGPVFWQGYPSSEIMVIEKHSPITVKNENLLFDFSDYNGSGYTMTGKVRATYEMLNPTNKPQSVQMAFPFVESLDHLLPEDIIIRADDIVLPYELYMGDVVNSYGNPHQGDKEASFDFARIVTMITNEVYQGKNFEEKEVGKRYRIEVKPTTDQRINLAVDFRFNFEKTKIFTTGFNRYERDDEKTRIAAWCYEPEILEIFVLGEDIDFHVNGYTDGGLNEKTDLFTYEMSMEEVEFKSYLMEYIKKNNNRKYDSFISDTQLYNVYAASLDRYFTQNMGYSANHDLMEQDHYKRIVTLVYRVEFPENSNREVSISYKTFGTMDKRETAKPLYSFDYILNPAKNWREFKNLNIKIIPPRESPYIVKSNIEWTTGENMVYTASLADLPEEDLSFTLYGDEKITLLDKTMGNLQNSFGYFVFPMVGAVLFFILGIIIWRMIRR